MGNWFAGKMGWAPTGKCPILVGGFAIYGPPAGMSSDGTLLYTSYSTGMEERTFPDMTVVNDYDYDPAMNTLGAGGGGNIRAATMDDTGHVFSIGYITSSTEFEIMKSDVDGSSPSLLWTSSVLTSGAVNSLQPMIGWHPLDPSYVYVVYGVDSPAGSSVFSKIHVGTGAESVIVSFGTGDFLANMPTFMQYDDGFVFFVGVAGLPTTGDIWVYDINAIDLVDLIPAPDSFGSLATRPDGLTYWWEDLISNGGDGELHAFTIEPGPTPTPTTPPCSNPFLDAFDGFDRPSYWFATPDRSQVYIGSGLSVWRWP